MINGLRISLGPVGIWKRPGSNARILGEGPTSLGRGKRAAKMLLRINTAYTKCKHVGGSELVFPILFGHLCYPTHRCWNVWMKTAVWRALESWRRAIGSVHAVVPKKVAEPESLANADRGSCALLPRTRRPVDGTKVEGPDGTLYETVEEAQEAVLGSQAMEHHLSVEVRWRGRGGEPTGRSQ